MKKHDYKRLFLTGCFAVVMSVSMTGCAGNHNLADGEVYDPAEGVNRAVFSVNDALDRTIAEPVARGYRAVTPKLARDAVRNFLRNLRTPINVANQVLQGDIEGAAGDLSRFAMNTTIGVGGMFDVAADTGLKYEEEDFGQTLAVWGFDAGPYMVLPLLGPSTLRDTTGLVVDTLADPVRIYLSNKDTNDTEFTYARYGATALSKREELLDAIDDLRKNSFDYYAAVRSAYMQKRQAMINDDDSKTSSAPSIPDYDDEND